jgi:glycosyltransferase involved in cell wall biosynthesis
VILEAGASGLPVVAIAEGGPAALVENRHTGLLCRPDADHIAGSLLQLAASPELRTKLGSAGVRGARARSWERSMSQLAAGYRLALDGATVSIPAEQSRPAPQPLRIVA